VCSDKTKYVHLSRYARKVQNSTRQMF
jgi:hypothetical protein